MPMQPAIVTVGTLPIDDRLRSLARSFGWWLFRVAEAHQVQAAGNAVDVVAILFEPREVASSWQEALKIVRSAAPRALPVVCHRFSDWLPWHELAAAGAFHELWLPFDVREVRQSWGFVQEARLRKAARPMFLPRQKKQDTFVA